MKFYILLKVFKIKFIKHILSKNRKKNDNKEIFDLFIKFL